MVRRFILELLRRDVQDLGQTEDRPLEKPMGVAFMTNDHRLPTPRPSTEEMVDRLAGRVTISPTDPLHFLKGLPPPDPPDDGLNGVPLFSFALKRGLKPGAWTNGFIGPWICEGCKTLTPETYWGLNCR